MNETFQEEVVSEHKKRWTRSTRRLTLGVAFATVLMLLYNILLYIPAIGSNDNGQEISGHGLVAYILYVIIGLVLAFLCIHNYLRGLSRFATCFERGGKRSLFLVRWGFLLSIAGIVLQIFVFFVIKAMPSTFLRLLIGNILLVAGAVVGIMGFLSLATSKGMTDDGRRAALHMSWTTIIILAGAVLLSYSLQKGMTIKVVTTVINVLGALLFFRQWKHIMTWPKEEETHSEETADAPEAETSTKETPTE